MFRVHLLIYCTKNSKLCLVDFYENYALSFILKCSSLGFYSKIENKTAIFVQFSYNYNKNGSLLKYVTHML